LFLDLTHLIAAVFWSKSRDPTVWGINRPWLWLEELLAYWHNNRCAVITLNYDTLIECVASATYSQKRPKLSTGEMYPIRLTPAVLEYEPAAKSRERIESFKLFKLHGSINWFYS